MFNINKPFTIEDLRKANEKLEKIFSEQIPTAIKVDLNTMKQLEKLPSTNKPTTGYAFSCIKVILDEDIDGWELVFD